MAKFSLHGETGSGSGVEVPDGVTTIGRGPFLKVTDKRVSRSHAQLEIKENKLFLLPTHANPCFYSAASSKGPRKPLARNKWHELCDGDTFSLLPDACVFTVVEIGRSDKLEDPDSDGSTDVDESMQQAAIAAKATSSATGDATVRTKATPVTAVSEGLPTTASSTSDERHLINNETPGTEPFAISAASNVDTGMPTVLAEAKKAGTRNDQSSAQETLVPKEKTSTTKRQLPAWLVSFSAKESKSTSKSKGKTGKEEEKETKTALKKGAVPAQREKGKKKLKDFSDSEEEVGTSSNAPASKAVVKEPSSSSGGKANRLQDFSDSDGDSHKPVAKPSSATSKPKRGTGQASSLKDFSDSEDEKQTGIASKPRQGSVGKRSRDLRDFSDSDLSNEEDQPLKKQAKGSTRTVAASSTTSDDKDDGDDLPPCQYGASCYRKNPQHFREYSHPPPLGTGPASTTAAASSDNSQGGDGSLPECPYGKLCYRKNPQHRQQFAHNLAGPEQKTETRRSTRKRTTKKGRSVLDGTSDDDGEANTYDYNDSFLDDDEDDDSDSMDFSVSDSEDEDWDPGSDTDVGELISEAKGFLKNKKMHKTV